MTMPRQVSVELESSEQSKNDVDEFEAELLADLEDEDLQVRAVLAIDELVSSLAWPLGL